MFLRSLLRWFLSSGDRRYSSPDFGPLPTRETDNGYERVIHRPDGLREHLPSRVTRVVPEQLSSALGNRGTPAITRRSPLFEPHGRRSDGTAAP